MFGFVVPFLLANEVCEWMDKLEKHSPYASTFGDTALAIASESVAHPLYPGDDGPARTAALLVATGWHESRFNPVAVGDHGKAFGLWQVHGEHAPVDELLDPARAARRTVSLLRHSLWTCRDKPPETRLAWFTAGNGCRDAGAATSRHRMGLAAKLLKGE